MTEKDLNERMRASILEATRLTHSGQLFEATAAIQRALQGTFAPESVADTGGHAEKAPIEGVFHIIDGASPNAKPGVRDKTSARGRFVAGTYTNQAGSRAYKLYIPSTYSETGQALPLIVMLHGCTQNPDDFAAGTRMNELAEEHRCLVVYPAQSREANNTLCWNWFRAGDQQRDRGEPSIIAGITHEIIATYRVDSQQVYVAGLSAGGAMAAVMGQSYPDLYAAIGVHSGLAYGAAHDLPSALTAMMNQIEGLADLGLKQNAPGKDDHTQIVPTIVFHGDRDTTVHPSNGHRFVTQGENAALEENPQVSVQQEQASVDGYAYTRTCHLDADGQTVMEHWLIHGAGHAWLGGSPVGTYTDPKGPDATQAMFRFFQQHRRRA